MSKKNLNGMPLNLKNILTLFGFGVVLVSAFAVTTQLTTTYTTKSNASEYNPRIKSSDFPNSTMISNKYFNLPPGKTMTYELETEEGLEKIEIQILNKKKRLMGINTIVYWDRVWLDTNSDEKFTKQELIEETYDYLAQDKRGNIWYFGEDVDNYENGKLIDHAGSWLAGKDGALPGIWIKGNHKVGDSYRQEYYAGEAEDMRDVVATGVTVTTKKTTYNNCIQMYDWSPLDPEAREYKYYCPQVGALVRSEHLDEEKNPLDATDLIKIQYKKGSNDDDRDSDKDDDDTDNDD